MWNWNKKRPPSFLEVFLPNFSADKLKIPPKFFKHLEGKTSGSVLLMGPSGNVWHVDLVKQKDGLFFCDGWPTFVKSHFIQCGDSLVFSYEGNLCFTVLIFDQSSCEKEQAFTATCSENFQCNGVERKRGREDEENFHDPDIDALPKKVRDIFSPVVLNSPNEKREIRKTKLLEIEPAGGRDVQATSSPCSERKLMDSSEKTIVYAIPASEHMRSKIIHHSKPFKKPESVTNKNKSVKGISHVSKCIEERVSKKPVKEKYHVSKWIEERVSRHFTSSFPYFFRIINWSHLRKGTMKIPLKFSSENLPQGRTKVVLKNEKGLRWTVNCIPVVQCKKMQMLSGGWTAFVRDNDIKMEDVCIFELVGDCELSVHVLRLGVEGLDDQNQLGAASRRIKGYHKKSSEIVTVEDLCDDPVPIEDGTLMIETPQEAACVADTQDTSTFVNTISLESEFADGGKDEHVTPDQSKGRKQVAECDLAVELADKGTMDAVVFTSPYPNFMKVLRSSNVSRGYVLKIPSEFARVHFPMDRIELVLWNPKRDCWTVNSIPSGGYHSLCGGWMSFVRANDLRLRDTCVFELIGQRELQVHIFRSSQGLECQSDDGGEAEESKDVTGCSDGLLTPTVQ